MSQVKQGISGPERDGLAAVTAAASHGPIAFATIDAGLRVVLVGRTGLENTLRREAGSGLELLRPRSVWDAIGELADVTQSLSVDEHGRPPVVSTRTLVLMAADALGADRSEAFVTAVHRIDPSAKVLRVDPLGAGGSGANGIGTVRGAGAIGVVPVSATSQQLRALARLLVPAVAGEPADELMSEPARVSVPGQKGVSGSGMLPAPPPLFPESVNAREPGADSGAAVSGAASGGANSGASVELGSNGVQRVEEGKVLNGGADTSAGEAAEDRTPLGAILAGRDPIAAGCASISALRGCEVRFVALKPLVAGADVAAPAGAEVRYGERLFGHLCAEGIAARELESEAAWLAGWVALSHQQDHLRRAAFTDELTGAFNRRYFNRFLTAAIDQARAARRSVALLVFDIDNFKRYNDLYGHAAGDSILVESVRLLKSIIRPTDRVCRVGGDEFAVIFHDPEGPRDRTTPAPAGGGGLQSVADIAKRFQKQICEHRFPKLTLEAPGTLSISGGMASFPWDGQTPTELLERADALAMQSKQHGKNTITLGQGAQIACTNPIE